MNCVRRSGPFLIQILQFPPVAPEERSNTYLIFPHFGPGGETGNQHWYFHLQNDYESVCACYICLTLPQEARSFERKTLRVITKKRQPWNRTHQLPPPIFLLPLTNEDIIVDLSPSSNSISPFSIPPSSHTCSMQISSDGSESGYAEEPDACVGSLSNLYTYRNEL